MSKKHHNYNNYSNRNFNYNNNQSTTPEVETTVVTEIEEEITNEVEAPVVNEPTSAKSVTGVVCNCEKLNVRKAPNAYSTVICVIPKNLEVEIDENESTNDFYKVRSISETEGFYGYCMKKYIKIRNFA